MTKVKVFDVVQGEEVEGQRFTVLLLSEDQKKFVPIQMAESQAVSIAHGVLKREFSRPMTYELMANLLETADVKVTEIHVESLKDSTFYGLVKIRTRDGDKDVDARPSDAIALALRVGCPIYVSDQVMKRTGVPVSDEDRKAKTTLEGVQDLFNTARAFDRMGKKSYKVKSFISDKEFEIET